MEIAYAGSIKRTVPPASGTLESSLIAAYLLLLPVQLPGASGRLAPSDLFLMVYLLLRLPWVRTGRAAWAGWHFALVGVFGLGLLVAMLRQGAVTNYAVFNKTIGLLVLCATYLAFVDFLVDWSRIRFVLRVFLIAVLTNAGIALAAFAMQHAGASLSFVNYEGARLSGFLVDPNAFGGLVVVALVIHLAASVSGTPLLRRGGMSATVLLSVALVLTFSRSAWIGFVAAIVAMLIADSRTGTRSLLRLLVPLVLSVPFLLVLVPGFTSLLRRPDQITGRVGILEWALQDFFHSPLFGVGLGVYGEQHNVIIHNTFIWFLTEFGVVGLTVLLGFVWFFFRRLWWLMPRVSQDHRPLVLGLLAAHAAMIGLSVGIEALYQRHWWVLLSIASAGYAVTSQREVTAARLPGTGVRQLQRSGRRSAALGRHPVTSEG